MRYQELFCKVVDEVLEGMASTYPGGRNGTGGARRDAIDVLADQRRAQQEAHRANNGDNGNIHGEDVNGPLGGGGLENDAAVRNAQNVNTAGGATEDLPPLLMRRYELRILPLKRHGVFPPFDRQYIDGKDSQYASEEGVGEVQGVSLRQVRSQAIGSLVTVCGMIVRASGEWLFWSLGVHICDCD